MAVPAVALRSKLARKAVPILVLGIVAFVVGTLILATMFVTAVADMLFGSSGSTTSSGSVSSSGSITITFSAIEPAESTYALQHIPSKQTDPSVVTFPTLYAAATQNGKCVLPWPILAGVTNEESSFGTSRATGVSSGRNGAGAEGPFQFEPPTFAGYANPVPAFPGAVTPPSIYDAVNAAFAAARKLCAGGILTNPKLALWTYNAGSAGISFTFVNGHYIVVYNDAPFAHSSDNPERYVLDVLSNAAKYGGGTISGSDNVSVTGLTPNPGSGNIEQYRQRSALWMDLLASEGNCQAVLHVSCFDALPTILNNYDGGIVLPYAPSQMQQDLMPVTTPEQGDIVLFGSYVKTKAQKKYHLVIDDGTYGVVVDSSANQIAMVTSGIGIVQAPKVVAVGQNIGGLTVQFIGSPFG